MNKRLIWWLLTLIWCYVIFFQSSKPAVESSSESTMIVDLINRHFKGSFGYGKVVVSENFVRKSAHFLEYYILGSLLFMSFLRRDKLFKTIYFAALSGLFYALSDEIHQYFVPGRAMRLLDVVIDSAGLFTGIYILYSIAKKRYIKPAA